MVLAFWVLGGLLSVVGGMCFAELATAYPEEGGPYQYLNRAFGRPAGYLYAWAQLLVVRPGSVVTMAFPFASYLYAVWPLGAGSIAPATAKLILAISAIVVLTGINIVGVKASTRMQNVLSLVKVLGIAIILPLPFLFRGDAASAAAVTDPGSASFGLALILVLFAYGGWSEISLVAGEVKRPERNLSRSIFLAVAVVGILYTAVNGVFLKILGLQGLSSSQAAATDAVKVLAPDIAGDFVSLLICISALGAVHGLIFTGSRVTYVLGEEHRAFKLVSGWSGGRGTPVRALLVQGALCVVVALATRSFGRAVVYTTSVVWVFYLLCGISVFVLRRRDPGRPRPYRIPMYPLVPIVFCVSCIFLVYSAVDYDLGGSAIALGLTALGMVLYRR